MIKPMLCRNQDRPFNEAGWIWERKVDGIRALVSLSSTGVSIQARSGKDKTGMFPELDIQAHSSCLLDGEIVSLDDKFNSIQHRMTRQVCIELASDEYPTKFVVFDLLSVEGKDIQDLPLEERRGLLGRILVPTNNVALSPYTTDGLTLYRQAIEEGWEGIVGKLLSGVYQQDKRNWIKVKNRREGIFFVCGYTSGTGWRERTFGSLVLGYLDKDSVMRSVGEVGTGFDISEIESLFSVMENSHSDCIFRLPPTSAVWVKPFPVRVKYLEVTDDGQLRFPVYIGREDQAAPQPVAGTLKDFFKSLTPEQMEQLRKEMAKRNESQGTNQSS